MLKKNFFIFLVFFCSLSLFLLSAATTSATWSAKTAAGLRMWQTAAISANGVKMAAAPNGYIYVSLDGGQTWQERTSAGSRDWRAITFSPDGSKLVAVADNGYIYVSNDDGVSWNEITNFGIKKWSGVALSEDGSKIFASATASWPGEYLYASVDGGISWNQLGNTQATTLKSVSTDYNGDSISTVSVYGVATSHDSGENWSAKLDTVLSLADVSMSANGNNLGQRKQLPGPKCGQILNLRLIVKK